MKKGATIFFFLLFSSGFLLAQETCAEKLVKANTLFEQGRIEEAIILSKPCASKSNDLTSRWQAYRMMAMAYLAIQQNEEARKAAEEMLELNPTYQSNLRNDPGEFIALLKSISVIPKFSLGLAFSAGANYTYPFVTATYTGAAYLKKYTVKQSYQFGAVAGYNFNKVLSLQLGMMASTKGF